MGKKQTTREEVKCELMGVHGQNAVCVLNRLHLGRLRAQLFLDQLNTHSVERMTSAVTMEYIENI